LILLKMMIKKFKLFNNRSKKKKINILKESYHYKLMKLYLIINNMIKHKIKILILNNFLFKMMKKIAKLILKMIILWMTLVIF
jgi:hypothetical protein